jgi:hypothetical protein
MLMLNKKLGSTEQTASVALAHSQVERVNMCIAKLLDVIVQKRIVSKENTQLDPVLAELASSTGADTRKISLMARHILVNIHVPSYEMRRVDLEKTFLAAIEAGCDDAYSSEKLDEVIGASRAIFDVLGEFFYNPRQPVCQAAMEVYVRRAYVAYELQDLGHTRSPSGVPAIQYKFFLGNLSSADPEGEHRARRVEHQKRQSFVCFCLCFPLSFV